MDQLMQRPNNQEITEQKSIIHLYKIPISLQGLRQFRNQILTNLGDSVFHYHSIDSLLFNVLKEISPINRTVLPNENSLEKSCESAIKHFGFHKEAIITSLTGNILSGKKANKNNREKFCRYILQMDKLPGHFYEELLNDVTEDLLKITELIKWYESQGIIQRHLTKNEIPRTHNDAIIFDFYKRCVKERIEILNHLLFGIKDRAIAKSSQGVNAITSSFDWISNYIYDRPYRFARPFMIYYFDYREIDLVGHRVADYAVSDASKMEQLYYRDKEKFYRKHFKISKAEQYFQNLFFYLSYLPLQKNRRPIFDELVRLFKAKKWISFYALALPQVEGLFSEMCEVASPESDVSTRALPYKVNTMRPYHEMSESYFDYFQYHIPRLRNKFSHTGYDENFKLNSYDLLLDLSHLLKIFYELDNPLVKIKQLHLRRSWEDFVSFKDIANYFQLLEKLPKNQRQEIQSSIDSFEREMFIADGIAEHFSQELILDLPKKLDDFINAVNTSLKLKVPTFEFKRLQGKEIETFLKEPEYFEALADSFTYQRDSLEVIEEYSIFLNYYKKYLPSLKSEVREGLKKLSQEFGELLENITKIKDLLTKGSN